MEQAGLGAFFVAIAVVGYRVAVGAESDPLVQYPIFLGSAAATIYAVWRLYRSLVRPLAQRVEAQERTLRRVENDRAIVRWQFDKLVRHLRMEGIPIPDDIERPPPLHFLPYPEQARADAEQ